MTLDERARIAAEALRSSLDGATGPTVHTIGVRLARRRVARLLGSGVALVALGLGVSVALHTGERDLAIEAGDHQDDKIPHTQPKIVVADGEFDGKRWQLEVYRSESGVCVDLRYQDGAVGGCGLGVPPRGVGLVHATAGSGEAVFGAVQKEVVRVEAVRASGAKSVVTPAGATEGLGIAFYAFVGSDEDPIETVVAYDVHGHEVDRIAADGANTPKPTTTSPTTVPQEQFSTDAKTLDSGTTSAFVGVRVLRATGVDRIVIEFEGTAPYIEASLGPTPDSGDCPPPDVEGPVFLNLRFVATEGETIARSDPVRYDGGDSAGVSSLVISCNYEGSVYATASLSVENPFALYAVDEDGALVVDIATGG